jgi:predicted CoA-binding protein
MIIPTFRANWELKQLPRSMRQETWKALWRQLRVVNREASKALEDCLLFGSGACCVGENVPDFIRHVPLHEMVLA